MHFLSFDHTLRNPGRKTHLHDVILADRADDPGVVGVPTEVGDLGRVAAMDEQQLGRPVLGILRALK